MIRYDYNKAETDAGKREEERDHTSNPWYFIKYTRLTDNKNKYPLLSVSSVFTLHMSLLTFMANIRSMPFYPSFLDEEIQSQ